jgi:hypothetical protein
MKDNVEKPQPVNGAGRVGYGNPPGATRFKKGQSGNPKGRPKDALNVLSLVAKAQKKKVVVNEKGRRKKITKLEAGLTQLVNKAASGDLRALQYHVSLAQDAETRESQSPSNSLAFSEADQKVIEGIAKRFQTVTDAKEGHDDKSHTE